MTVPADELPPLHCHCGRVNCQYQKGVVDACRAPLLAELTAARAAVERLKQVALGIENQRHATAVALIEAERERDELRLQLEAIHAQRSWTASIPEWMMTDGTNRAHAEVIERPPRQEK